MEQETTTPDPIDVATGAIVRGRRRVLRISQEALAEACGVSFQQIQKYENGANRISISRLFQIAKRLECSPADLLPTGAEVQLARQADKDPASEWLMGRMAFDLAQAMTSIPENVARQLVEAMTRTARSLAIIIPPGRTVNCAMDSTVDVKFGDQG